MPDYIYIKSGPSCVTSSTFSSRSSSKGSSCNMFLSKDVYIIQDSYVAIETEPLRLNYTCDDISPSIACRRDDLPLPVLPATKICCPCLTLSEIFCNSKSWSFMVLSVSDFIDWFHLNEALSIQTMLSFDYKVSSLGRSLNSRKFIILRRDMLPTNIEEIRPKYFIHLLLGRLLIM